MNTWPFHFLHDSTEGGIKQSNKQFSKNNFVMILYTPLQKQKNSCDLAETILSETKFIDSTERKNEGPKIPLTTNKFRFLCSIFV